MDRDQDKFYQDEEFETNDGAQTSHGEELNDMEYFLELLKHLRLAIETGGKVPLTNKVIVDADKCLLIIDDLKNNLPDAVQYGMQMYSERQRILGEAEDTAINRVTSAEMRANAALEKAKKDAEQLVIDAENEADAILADAEERAQHMVSESEIVRKASEEARIIRNDARVEANEMRLKANHDAHQLLLNVENELAEACKNVRRRRSELGDDGE